MVHLVVVVVLEGCCLVRTLVLLVSRLGLAYSDPITPSTIVVFVYLDNQAFSAKLPSAANLHVGNPVLWIALDPLLLLGGECVKRVLPVLCQFPECPRMSFLLWQWL